ncbi:YibE/F family protein [Corynebacterium phocae]|uniref:YibE/F family protein n=1 Tax=Corynebacterium phocae TaxID=161895 RepID=A0A1L7D5E4_9CORY|nr:YibE/F family protein [Corynebacterium phocae]APT93358.1 YibE/F family protein [Corynebacterium phocae]KAA8721696.1 YibE/F family protein [Corynebacterium phocae]
MGRHSSAHAVASRPKRSPWRVGLLVGLATCFIATVVGLVALWPSGDADRFVTEQFSQTYALNQPQVSGTVVSVDDQLCNSQATGQAFSEPPPKPAFDEQAGCERSLVELNSGNNAGKYTQLVHWGLAGDPTLAEGDRILLSESADSTYSFADFERGKGMWLWLGFIVAAIVIFAAWHGLRALVGLAYSLALIFVFLLPALIEGRSPLLVALVCGAAVVMGAIPLVHGVNWKSAAALGGTLLSLGAAGVFAKLAIDSTALTGMSNEENLKLALYLPSVSIVGVLLCGFVVGALGGLNDVAIAQASTVNELAAVSPDASPWQLFVSAMKVGRDHIASMVYTIILSYTGAVLPLLILISAASRPAGQILTSDLIATELMRSGVGALALTLSVPLTTVLAALTVKNQPKSQSQVYNLSHD